MANIGFLLNKSPFSGESLETIFHLSTSALEKKHKVFIFLHNDGVFSPVKGQKSFDHRTNPKELLEELVKKGATVFCSNMDIKRRGLEVSKNMLDGVKTGTLSDMAEAVSNIDRLVTL